VEVLKIRCWVLGKMEIGGNLWPMGNWEGGEFWLVYVVAGYWFREL